MRGRATGAAVLVLAAAALGVVVARGREDSRRSRPEGRLRPKPKAPGLASRPPEAAPAPAPPSATLPAGGDPTADLAGALTDGDAAGGRAAARDLRRLLRTDPEALARARDVLLDPTTAPDLRGALALVLGTLPGDAGDPALLEALRRFSDDAGFLRLALLALGGQREPEDDDDVFGLGDRPYGVSGPSGLGITVRRKIPAGEARDALLAHLAATAPEARDAAARALARTVSEPPVRTVFLQRLAGEASGDVLATLGEPLARWAGSSEAAPGEVDEVLAALLARAAEPGLDAFRFRLEDEFDRLPVSAERAEALAGLSGTDRPFAVRSFALTALARASRRGEAARDPARRALAGALSDADPAVRDLAARSLRDLPHDPSTAASLASLARADPAWNVRHAALETLVATAPAEEAAPVLRRAQSDPDRRVADRATALLAALGGRPGPR